MNTLPFPKQSQPARESHCDLILQALKRGEKLTCVEILDRFQCNSGKQRVWDLRHLYGWNVKGEIVWTRSGKRIMQWYLDPNDLFIERNGHKKEKKYSVSELRELVREYCGHDLAEALRFSKFTVWIESHR